MIYPIWKDLSFPLSGDKWKDYIISYKLGESMNPIYSGRAYRRPDVDAILVQVNDVCADWLQNSLPALVEGFDRADLPVTFALYEITEAGQYILSSQWQFINDWSYDEKHDPERDGLAAPINGHLDSKQWLLWTGINVSEVEASVTLKNGVTMKVIIPIAISNDFNEDYNEDFSKSVRSAGSGTLVINPMQWGDVAKISIGNASYEIVKGCCRYALYYQNAYGGWDSFLIEGLAQESDALTRMSMERVGAYNRQKDNYLNKIEKKITLNTSWLSDEESLRMHHLLNSTDVYLHDLDRDEIIPVIMEGSDTPYKTFKGEGGRLVSYAIEIAIAQTRYRR